MNFYKYIEKCMQYSKIMLSRLSNIKIRRASMNSNSEEKLNDVFLQLMRIYFIRTHFYFDKLGLYHGQPQILFL